MAWRGLADKKQWSEIKPSKMLVHDLLVLRGLLAEVVPKVERGDGLEWYEDFATEWECQDTNTGAAASLLGSVVSAINHFDTRRPVLTHPFLYGLQLVDYIFAQEGFPDGYPDSVFWSIQSQKWKPLKRELVDRLREADMARSIKDEADVIDAEWVKRDIARRRLRPWRYNLPTNRFVTLNHQPNSLIWLADALHGWIDAARSGIAEVSEHSTKRLERKYNAYYLVDASMKVGGLIEAIEWKLNHESAAIRAYEYSQRLKKNAPAGGAATSQNAKDARTAFFNIALENASGWIFKTPNQQVSFLRDLTIKQGPDDLFMRGGKPLSKNWFKDALSELRQSGELEKALKKA